MSFFGKMNINELSETERAIYHFMTSRIDKLPYMRVREIAIESHTSAASVMRFIHKLGYDSFAEFKTGIKHYEYEVSDLPDGSSILSFENFPDSMDYTLNKIVEIILRSENLVFIGMGSSGTMCEYASRLFATLGVNSVAISDPTYPVIAKLRNTSDNTIILLSITGTTSEIVEMASSFKNFPDITTVAITSDPSSTLAVLSDYVLSYSVDVWRLNLHEDMTTQLPCIYLIEALARKTYLQTARNQ